MSAAVNTTENSVKSELSLWDVLIALGIEKKSIFICTALGFLIALAMALTSAEQYTAKTVILPPQQSQNSAASALAGLSGIAGLSGTSLGNVRTQDELFMALLRSERVQNGLIQRLSLLDRFKTESMLLARTALSARMKVASDKKAGLITLEVTDADPKFAALLANAHVAELGQALSGLAVSEAQQRRKFFELQVSQVKDQLAKNEIAFRQAQTQSGMQVTQALAETGVKASVELRQQIAAREVQLQALRTTYATDQNADVIRLSRELSALRGQLAKTEKGTSGVATEGRSSVGQEAVRVYRDIKVQEAMLDVFIRQYEMARVDESREGPLLQQVDVATIPEIRSAPKRTLIVLLGLLIGFVVGLVVAGIRCLLRKMTQDPELNKKSIALMNAWRLSFQR